MRMANWIAGGIGHEVLLRDIGDIFGFRVFGEEMIERLILARPDLFGDRLPPCLGIREDRVHVVDDPPEGKFAVFDHLTYGELRGTGFQDMEAAAKGPRTGGGWPACLARSGTWLTVVNRRLFRCQRDRGVQSQNRTGANRRKTPYIPLFAKPPSPMAAWPCRLE